MDDTQTYFALREAGITLVLSKDRDRLYPEPADGLSVHLEAALADNHEMLLKQELLREVLRFLSERFRQRDGNPEGDYSPSAATRAVFEIMAHNQELISDDMDELDCEGFKQSLRRYTRSMIEAHDNARAQLEKERRDSQQPSDETPADQPPGPLQKSLI